MSTADDVNPDNEVNLDRRRLLTNTALAVSGVGIAFAAVPFIQSWSPSERAQAAGAPVKVDISKLGPGELKIVEWRGKPVWLVKRTPAMLDGLAAVEGELRDPQSDVEQQPEYAKNETRSLKPELLVMVGICTHLGCSPTFRPEMAPGDLGPDWKGGFFCPCHGSRFDLAGRVYKGVPAPTNMEVPPYKFLTEDVVLVGSDEETA